MSKTQKVQKKNRLLAKFNRMFDFKVRFIREYDYDNHNYVYRLKTTFSDGEVKIYEDTFDIDQVLMFLEVEQ